MLSSRKSQTERRWYKQEGLVNYKRESKVGAVKKKKKKSEKGYKPEVGVLHGPGRNMLRRTED